MGIETDNWPATVGIFTGVFAKEVVVGTLNALYENLDGVTQAKERFDFGARCRPLQQVCRRIWRSRIASPTARTRPGRPGRYRGSSRAAERRHVDHSADAAALRH
jgi:Fe2+ transport system protein B